MKQPQFKPLTKQSGIALVIVLWMLSLLIILVTGYSHMVRIETNLTANMVHFSQAKAIAEAGVWQAVTELLNPKAAQKWNPDGTEYSFEFKQGNAKLNILDESGKIDLNTADSQLLYGLIKSIELPETKASMILQAILDWRDQDNLVRNNGAEDNDYQQRGYHYGAKDGPFNSLDELQLVMGMTTAIFNKLNPALTIHSRQSGIDPNFAPKEVLLAIPGISANQVDDFLQYRAREIDPSALLMDIDQRYLSRSNERIFTITSEGIIGETHARLNVIVLMNRHVDRPYTILSWQESSGRRKNEPELEENKALVDVERFKI